MSLTSDYYKALEELKKKKQNQTAQKTSQQKMNLDRYRSIVGSAGLGKKDDDEEDIAPIRTKKDEEEEGKLDFFQKVEVDDGWDIAKAILGTAGDAGLNVVKGVASLGEGLGDLVAYGAAGVGDMLGKDEWAKGVRKRASENYIDSLLKPAEDALDNHSILGRTSDSVLQGIGQVGGILATGGMGSAAGLGQLGTTALTTGTMFASGTGSGMSEAYQGGASDQEAATYGLISGAADAITELIFGGLGKSINAVGLSKGLSSADDLLAKKLTSKISNTLAKNFVQFGVKASAEGAEEWLAGFTQAIGKKATYMSEKDFKDIVADENLLEQFVVGALTSGVAQSGDLVRSTKAGRDFISGLNADEQTVVDKVYEDRVAKAEEGGKKLTGKEKSKIYDVVQEHLKKGYIDADTVESILGGESYTKYKTAMDNFFGSDTYKSYRSAEDAKKSLPKLQEEYDTLHAMKRGDMTGEQQDREASLFEQINAIKSAPDTSGLKAQLDTEAAVINNMKAKLRGEVSSRVKDGYLAESYRELERKGQKFEADMSKYTDENAKKTVQNILDSGIRDNSNQFHETVDFLARMSADKGVTFKLTDNKLLSGTVHDREGLRVNGFKIGNEITVNRESPNALNTIVGHEITHVLEVVDGKSSKSYQALAQAVKDFYIAREGLEKYNARIKTAERIYKGDENTTPEAEVVADLVGEYIFTDYDFVQKLSAENRNVFQKVYDEIKYLLKIATAGSKEARELEKAKKMFDRAYRENVQGKPNTKLQHSLTMVEDVQPHSDLWHRTATTEEAMAQFPNMWNVAAEESEVRNPTQISTTVKSYRKVYKFLQDEGFNGTILDASSGLGYGTKAGIEEFGFDVEDIEPYPDQGYEPKYTDYSALDKKYDAIISNAVLNVLPQDQRDALVVKMGELLNDGGRMFINVRGKDVESLAKTGKNIHLGNMEWIETVKGSYQKGFTKDELKAYLEDALGDGFTVEKTNMFGAVSVVVTKDSGVKYSLSTDSNGNQLSDGQKEFFKDSKVVDENGNLKVMYHGTSYGGHTVFDAWGKGRYGLFGIGTYFTESRNIAETYTKKGKGNNPQVYECYLNITKPMDMDAQADPTQWQEAFPDAYFPESGTNEEFYRAMEEYFEDEGFVRWEAEETAQEAIMGMGYDGITHIGGGRVNPNGERHRVFIAFDPEQVKNTDNANPTSDPDIRYSISDSDGNQLSKDQQEFFKDAKTRDADGNLQVLYHGSRSEAFSEFDLYEGVWLTSDPRYAEIYAGQWHSWRDDFAPVGEGRTDLNGLESEVYSDPDYRVYKMYANIKNPADIGELDIPLSDAKVRQLAQALGMRYTELKPLADTFMEEETYMLTRSREFIELAKEKGFDGFKATEKGKQTWCAFVSEDQVKLTTNATPTANPDVRYSISEDSQGRELSAEQQEFFKDSKVVDENGKLKVVYHGSPADFNTFSLKHMGTNGTAEGYGFYFTDKKHIAENYTRGREGQQTGDTGKLFEVYLDIKKPLSDTEVTMSRAEFRKFLIELNNQVDADGEPLDVLSNYGDVEWEGLNKVINYAMEIEYDGSDNDVNLVSSIINGTGNMEAVLDVLRKTTGYDGIIVNEASWGGDQTIYLTFHPEQIKNVDNQKPTTDPDIRYSLSEDTNLADKAIAKNDEFGFIDNDVMTNAKVLRERIVARLSSMKENGVAIPDDIKGNTAISNSSYDITEENTTICPRSLAAEAFTDAVSEYLGRPLSVEEQIYISQDLQGRSLTPECTYCYVATDRKAYRAFLGEYINQRDAVLQKVKDNPDADVSRSGELYKEFLDGRKDTNPMYNRFKMWVNAYKNGTPLIDGSHLANISKLMGDINSEFGAELKPQIVDAMKYAQSASWAKKRVSYVAYDGHILKWKQNRIDKLNSHYGLRMYSFSDFHPAFVLENMQMITDASVRGLKMLGYTKDTDFVEIFAPTGMNINISTFGFESGGNVYENNIIGANWDKAKALREQNPNVGITFVATNDHLVEWALAQDWIDVVIPYHLVRTGEAVAKAFNYTNYTSESSDTKTKDWTKGEDQKYIAPTEHNNDKQTYLAALARNHLNPRFERFLDNPNYMKLVNECRQPASVSKPVQPVFNEEAAMNALAKLEANGYYQPVGGSVDRMYEIAAEVAENMTQEFAPVKNSLSDIGEKPNTYGNYHVYGSDFGTPADPLAEFAPTVETVSQDENATETVETEQNVPIEQNVAPVEEDEATTQERLASLSEEDAPPEVAPVPVESSVPADPFADKDIKAVGKKGVHAFMFDNPEVKPFFQSEANVMLGELNRSVKGERIYNEEGGWTGTSRYTSDEIAYLRDELGYSYADIEKGLNAIIEDNGKENIAVAKKIEFLLSDRLRNGYRDFETDNFVLPNQDYLNLLNGMQTATQGVEALDSLAKSPEGYIPPEDIAPVAETPVASEAPIREYEAIRPEPKKKPVVDDDIAPVYGDKLVRVDSNNGRPGEKQRKWVGTSTDSEAVDRKVLPDDLDQDLIHYQPISNKKTLGNANAKLNSMGYEASVAYLNGQFSNNKVTLDDIALGERLIQEAVKRGDTKTAGDLIMDISILGTELGQKVQALSIIKRLTPEGQLRMLQRTIERGKAKGDKAYEGVELTQDIIDKILSLYGKDGTYDQAKLNEAVEKAKKQIADQMKVTAMDKINAWRYLSMLGNPKTHIRNVISNVAMRGTVAVKNAVARTIESIAPIKNRTKTWTPVTKEVKAFTRNTAIEMQDVISGDSKYSEDASIKQKRDIFKLGVLNKLYEFNSDWLEKEDWWFSKPAFIDSMSEYLTANGIRSEQDIKNNPKVVEKAKVYATEQAQIATFRQYSWLSNKIGEMERHNAASQIAVGSIMPFKKTPINIAKTGLNYSPLGFAKTLTYDVAQVKNGNMEASDLVDHLAQNMTGSTLTLLGYMLASAGFLSGGGEDDKEGKYDYQLGEQGYAINIDGNSYSLSWLSPVAMPLFVGANAYEQLVEGKEWNGDVVVQTLAQTLDPLSEMSFLSGLNDVLSSYGSGMEKFAGVGEAMAQNYITQFVPTLSSQVATVMDDTKRSTKVGSDSGFKFFDETINKLKLKIPVLRQTLEPSTDIWGNNVMQTENVITRAVETFLAPYSGKSDISTHVDEEIKALYRQTGENGLIPAVPDNYVNFKDKKYEMSAEQFTAFKKTYGQTAYNLLEKLFGTETYKNASSEDRADLVEKVYDYARDRAKLELLRKHGVQYTNAQSDKVDVYKENPIKGAIENDMMPDEYSFSVEYPEKYEFFKANNITYADYKSADEDGKRAYTWAYENPGKYTMSKAVTSDLLEYRRYASNLNDIRADKNSNGKTISGSAKEKKINYINGLNIDYGAKLILFKSEYQADDTYNMEIVEYLNSIDDFTYEDRVTILQELGFTVGSDGTVYWD